MAVSVPTLHCGAEAQRLCLLSGRGPVTLVLRSGSAAFWLAEGYFFLAAAVLATYLL